MSKKVKKILLGMIVSVLLLAIMLFQLNQPVNQKDQKEKKNELLESIIEKIQNQEDVLVYITDNEEKCYNCIGVNNIIDYYSDKYKLKFIYYNISKNNKEDLEKRLDITANYLEEPAVIFIKEGQLRSIANAIVSEDLLREFSINNEFIPNDLDKDIQINLDQFEEKFMSENKSLLVIYPFNDIKKNHRKMLFELSEQYHFSYDVVYSGMSQGGLIMTNITKKMDVDEISFPLLVIIQNNDVVDYISTTEEKDIITFLKKNEFIKES